MSRHRHHDRTIARNYSGQSFAPTPEPAPSLSGDPAVQRIAQSLCEASPTVAARAFAKGLMPQARPGRVAAICHAVDTLAESDPGIVREIADALAARAALPAEAA